MRKLFYPVISSVFFASIIFTNEDRIEDPKVDSNDRQEKPQVEKPLSIALGQTSSCPDQRPSPSSGVRMGSSTLANWIKEKILKKTKQMAKKLWLNAPNPNLDFRSNGVVTPEIQLTDVVKLPGNFGMGSSTLAYWIKENIEEHGMPEKPVLDPSDPRRIENRNLHRL